MKGRKPAPAEAMQARGTRKKHRDAGKSAAKTAAASKTLSADAPAHVENPEARAFWKRIAALLAPLGFIRSTDEIVLALLCDTLAEYHQCTAEIEAAGGLTYEAASYVNAKSAQDAAREEGDDAGVIGARLIRAHPAVMIRRRARQDIVNLCERLGMTPATRYQLLKEASAGVGAATSESGAARRQDSGPAEAALPHLFN